jgi:hypothetical protein
MKIPGEIRDFAWRRTVAVRLLGTTVNMSVASELPDVNGQHSNRALAASKRASAVELKFAGLSYERIATNWIEGDRGPLPEVVHRLRDPFA